MGIDEYEGLDTGLERQQSMSRSVKAFGDLDNNSNLEGNVC